MQATTMSAALWAAPGHMEVREYPIPVPGPGEVLVKVERAAICGSDLHSIYDGLGGLNAEPMPGRPGHEAVGTIVESTVDAWAPGDRVLALGVGAFAEYYLVAADQCIAVPTDDTAERLVIAQQMGVTHFGLTRFWPMPVTPGLTAVVLGVGPVGYLFAAQLRARGFDRILVSDRVQSRLDAASAVADDVVLEPGASIVDATLAATGGVGADLVIEAAGSDSARSQAIECVRQGGRVGYFGYPERHGDVAFPYETAWWKTPLSIEIVANAQSVAGLPNFHAAVGIIADGSIDISPLTGVTYRLAEIDAALDEARSMRSMKVQLEF